MWNPWVLGGQAIEIGHQNAVRSLIQSDIPSGTSYMRTLESHDKHTIASAY